MNFQQQKKENKIKRGNRPQPKREKRRFFPFHDFAQAYNYKEEISSEINSMFHSSTYCLRIFTVFFFKQKKERGKYKPKSGDSIASLSPPLLFCLLPF